MTRVLIAVCCLLAAAPAAAEITESAPLPDEIMTLVQEIQTDIEEIRGRTFKTPIAAHNQTLEDFGLYLDEAMVEQIPPELAENYDAIVRTVGLYRGEPLEDFATLAKTVMMSQAAAYYDPGTESFYVVMHDLPQMMRDPVYAHELYHGMQDQYFDLDAYYVKAAAGRELNDDELLARQSVVEGEAMYIMTLYSMKAMMGQTPGRAMLGPAVKMQAAMDIEQIVGMMDMPGVEDMTGTSMEDAVAAMDDIPRFILETLLGAYLKGMAFVYDVQEGGWEAVDELFARPPVSSEQILHPEKWVAGETPLRFAWPDLEGDPFDGWELLHTNVLGEFQMRVVFAEHDMKSAGADAAAGWDGDAYAVLSRKSDGATMLLLATAWDAPEEATEFYGAYDRLLAVKYDEPAHRSEMKLKDGKVFVVEGPADADLDGALDVLRSLGSDR